MKHILTILLGIFIGHSVLGQMFSENEKSLIRKGNEDYLNGSFVESEVNYKKALEKNSRNAKAAFNLGDALYNQERYEDAAAQFDLAAKLAENKADKAQALHNMGNSLLKKQDLAKSIDAYKNALKLNPGDMDTKYNLAYAMQMMKQQQNQDQQNQDKQNQDKNDQQNKDQQDQDQENQDQENQDKQENEEQNQDKQDEQKQNENQQQNQNQDQQNADQKDGKQQQQPQQMSKEELEQMLNALRFQEEKLQKELQKKKIKGPRVKVEKDW